MKPWINRIKSRMKELGLTQEMLGRKVGLTHGAINHYLSGRRTPTFDTFERLSIALKTDPAWLQFGRSMEAKSNAKITSKTVATKPKRLLPILSYEQAAKFTNSNAIINDEIKEFLPYFYIDHPQWYAMRIRDDSMTSTLGHKKSFHEGELIVVDCSRIAQHGDNVIALLPLTEEVVFKQFVIDGGIKYLKPINPQYPITRIDDSTMLCGVVVACIGL